MDPSAFQNLPHYGAFGQGFVVDENLVSPGAVRCNTNPVTNVAQGAESPPTNYTIWDNHHTVRHGDFCWDPCYGIKYVRPEVLVVYNIKKSSPALPYLLGVGIAGEEVFFVHTDDINGRAVYSEPLESIADVTTDAEGKYQLDARNGAFLSQRLALAIRMKMVKSIINRNLSDSILL